MKRKYKDTGPYKTSSKELLIALLQYPEYLKLLKTSGFLENFRSWLVSNAWRMDDDCDEPLPTMGALSVELKMDAAKIRKGLSDLYQGILALNGTDKHLFCKKGEILCILHFKFFAWHASFSMGLKVVPRVGEEFTFYFIHPATGGRSFHVYFVYHGMTSSGHEIDIYLTSNQPNTYFQMLKAKAYLHHEISFNDYFDIDNEYQLGPELINRFSSL